MKRTLLNFKTLTATFLTIGLMTACSSDDTDINTEPETEEEIETEESRWITVAGAKMGDEAGDGNGGTFIYSITSDEAKDPSVSISQFHQIEQLVYNHQKTGVLCSILVMVVIRVVRITNIL